MLAFPSMLVGAAKAAGINLPDNIEEYDPNEFPHWHVYLSCQLGTAMPRPDSHWNNARVVADISDKKIKKITGAQLLEAGLEVGYPLP